MANGSDNGENSCLRCRICLLTDAESRRRVVNDVCSCKGASGAVHLECLQTWIEASERDHCEVCLQKINIERVPEHGVAASVAVFMYRSRVTQLLLIVVVVSVAVYVTSFRYIDQLTAKHHRSAQKKIVSFFANSAIFASVFVISYSPLICLYLWDLWKEWRRTQYHLRISRQQRRPVSDV